MMGTGRHPGLFKEIQNFRMRPKSALLIKTQPVRDKPKPPPGHERGIQKLERPGGRVPRIGEKRFALFFFLAIQLQKNSFWHKNLTADLKRRRNAPGASEPLRDFPYRSDVFGHVIAGPSVPSRSRAHERPALIKERQRDPVYLKFRDVLKRFL